jgi:hypothetical protein
MREAFRGLGTDEDEVYRILRYPKPVVREMMNFYNANLNDHTGMGLVADINDEFSGDELQLALSLLSNAAPDLDIGETKFTVPTDVMGEPGKVWVGLIVRGKLSPAHHPGLMEQHADVVFPGPAGEVETRGYFPKSGAPGGGTTGAAGLDLPAVSADLDWFVDHRPWFVYLEIAKATNLTSSLILVKTTAADAATLSTYWDDLEKDPGAFYILGKNCSTAAAAGFERAHIAKEITGLDTPDHLFEQLRERYADAYMISGYFGYERAGMTWSVVDGLPTVTFPGSGPWVGPFVIQTYLK